MYIKEQRITIACTDLAKSICNVGGITISCHTIGHIDNNRRITIGMIICPLLSQTVGMPQSCTHGSSPTSHRSDPYWKLHRYLDDIADIVNLFLHASLNIDRIHLQLRQGNEISST